MSTHMTHQKLKAWQENLGDAPSHCLNTSSRNQLASHLDVTTEVTSLSDEGFSQDWTGLAELMGYTHSQAKLLEKPSIRSPTRELLDQWGKKSGATVKELVGFLWKMDRYDLLENSTFRKCIDRDVQKYNDSFVEEQEMDTSDSKPVQVNRVVSSTPASHGLSQPYEYEYYPPSSYHTTTDDFVISGGQLVPLPKEKQRKYDAYVTYAHNDFAFVAEMWAELEKPPYNLKLCVSGRQLLAGGDECEVTAQLIQDRCKRVIIVVSPNFLRSPICEFQVKFSHNLSPGSRSKKLVPVMKDMEDPKIFQRIPPILRHITMLDYEKQDLKEWFWQRLGMSIMAPLQLEPEDFQTLGDLSEVSLPESIIFSDLSCLLMEKERIESSQSVVNQSSMNGPNAQESINIVPSGSGSGASSTGSSHPPKGNQSETVSLATKHGSESSLISSGSGNQENSVEQMELEKPSKKKKSKAKFSLFGRKKSSEAAL